MAKTHGFGFIPTPPRDGIGALISTVGGGR